MKYEEIKRFCGNGYPEPYKLKSGEVFATNRHLMIFCGNVPDIGNMPNITNKPPMPDFEKAKGLAIGSAISFEILDGKEVKQKPCQTCKQTGQVVGGICERCDDFGEINEVCSCCGRKKLCPDCNGTGELEKSSCKDCGGLGVVFEDTKIEGVLFAGRYIDALAKLPGCCLTIGDDPEEPQRFDFEEGFGYIMPKSYKTPEELAKARIEKQKKAEATK